MGLTQEDCNFEVNLGCIQKQSLSLSQRKKGGLNGKREKKKNKTKNALGPVQHGWNGNYWPSPNPGVTFCLELQCAFILGCPQPLQYHLNTWPTRPSVFLLSPVTDKSLLLAAKRRVKPETSRLSILSIHLRSWKNHHSTRERKCGGKRNLTVLRMLQMS